MSKQESDSISKFFKDYTPLSYYLLKKCFRDLSYDAKYQIISGARKQSNAGVNYVLDNHSERFVSELIGSCGHELSGPGKAVVWTPESSQSPDDAHNSPLARNLSHLELFDYYCDDKLPEPSDFWSKEQFERLVIANYFNSMRPESFVSIIVFGDKLVSNELELDNPAYSKELAEKVSAQDVEEVMIQFLLGANCRFVRKEVEWVNSGRYVTPLNFSYEEEDDSDNARLVKALWEVVPKLSSHRSKLLIRVLPSIDIFVTRKVVDELVSKFDEEQLQAVLGRDDIYLLELRRKILLSDDATDYLRWAAVGSRVFNVDEYLIDEIIGNSSSTRPETLPKRRHAARYLLAYCKNLSLPYILILEDWLGRTRFEPEPLLDNMDWYSKHSLTEHVYDAKTRRIAFLCSSEDRLKLRYEYSQAEAFLFAQCLAMDRFSKEDLSQIADKFKIFGFPRDPWETYKWVVRRAGNSDLFLDFGKPRDIEHSLLDSSSDKIPLFAKVGLLENNKIMINALQEEIEKIFDKSLKAVLEKMRASMDASTTEFRTLVHSKCDDMKAVALEADKSRDMDSKIVLEHLGRLNRKYSVLIFFIVVALAGLFLSRI